MNPTRCLPLLLSLAACQSTVGVDVTDPPEGGGGAAASTPGEPSACELPRDGEAFTFTIRNTGTRTLSLDFGCFDTPPITVDGRGIAPGAADLCGVDCREVWEGYENLGCSTLCGPDAFRALPPGGEVEVEWDRRLFVEHLAPPECTGLDEPIRCALGEAAPPAQTFEAALEVCPHGAPAEGEYVPCDAEAHVFDLDLAGGGLVVEVE